GRTDCSDRSQSDLHPSARLRRPDRRCPDRDTARRRRQGMTNTGNFAPTKLRGLVLTAAAALTLSVLPASAQTAPESLSYKGPDRQQKLIEGARQEGQVVFYSAMIVNQAVRPIAEKFGKKYPFLKLNYWRADSEDIAQKISAEVRANNVVADVFEGTG